MVAVKATFLDPYPFDWQKEYRDIKREILDKDIPYFFAKGRKLPDFPDDAEDYACWLGYIVARP